MNIKKWYMSIEEKVKDFIIAYLLIFILAYIIIVTLAPYILTRECTLFPDFTCTGTIGDTIGGITAPFIGFLAAILTFLAFKVQYNANERQKEQMAQQNKNLSIERFEHNFFNFLNQLRELEKEVLLNSVGTSKQAFHFMFYEYKAIYMILLLIQKMKKIEIPENILLHKVAFDIFLNGVSKTSTSRMKENGDPDKRQEEDRLKDVANNVLLKIQQKRMKRCFFIPYLGDYHKPGIKMFDGHRCRLIPFYRMFYKIVEYVFRNKKLINDGKQDKQHKFYIDMLLSQLSEHEISLLKIMHKFDQNENEYFQKSEEDSPEENYQKELDNFFNDEINKYIYSDIMNVEKEKFIDKSLLRPYISCLDL